MRQIDTLTITKIKKDTRVHYTVLKHHEKHTQTPQHTTIASTRAFPTGTLIPTHTTHNMRDMHSNCCSRHPTDMTNQNPGQHTHPQTGTHTNHMHSSPPTTPPGQHPAALMVAFTRTIKIRKIKLLRKEVIQPHLPVRLPCYDFVPIADPTFDSSLTSLSTGFGCYQLS